MIRESFDSEFDEGDYSEDEMAGGLSGKEGISFEYSDGDFSGGDIPGHELIDWDQMFMRRALTLAQQAR